MVCLDDLTGRVTVTDVWVDEKTWSETIAKLVRAGDMSLMPWQLKLDYDHWTYRTLDLPVQHVHVQSLTDSQMI